MFNIDGDSIYNPCYARANRISFWINWLRNSLKNFVLYIALLIQQLLCVYTSTKSNLHKGWDNFQFGFYCCHLRWIYKILEFSRFVWFFYDLLEGIKKFMVSLLLNTHYNLLFLSSFLYLSIFCSPLSWGSFRAFFYLFNISFYSFPFKF